MKPYRPPDWDKINPKPIGTSMGYGFTREDMYKRGEDCADAMLEALRKEGVCFDLRKGDVLILPPAIVTNLLGRPIGKLVLIPDEE